VQIDVTVAEIAALVADPGEWSGVLAEIARSWADRTTPARPAGRAGSPAVRSPATTTCGIRTVWARAVPVQRGALIWITPATGLSAARRSSGTWGRCALVTTTTRTGAGR